MWSLKRKFGNIGEDLVVKKLRSFGYEIVEQNYLRKWGEIDIVSKKDGVLHFVEVKTVTCDCLNDVTHETGEYYRAEENMTVHKMKKMSKIIDTYLESENVSDETPINVCLAAVYIEKDTNKSYINFIEDIVLE